MGRVHGAVGAQQRLAGDIQHQAGDRRRHIDGTFALAACQHIGEYAARAHVGHDHRGTVRHGLGGHDLALQDDAHLPGGVTGHEQQFSPVIPPHVGGKAGHQGIQIPVGHVVKQAGAAQHIIIGGIVHRQPPK